MFAAANFLSYQCGLRSVWFPDINHVESNVEKGVMNASGLSQVNEKVSFLSRLPYGPQRDAGHWFGQMRLAFEASLGLLSNLIKSVFGVMLHSQVLGPMPARLGTKQSLVVVPSPMRAVHFTKQICLGCPHSWEALEKELRRGSAEVRLFFGLYLPRICSDLGLSNPDEPHTMDAVCHDLIHYCYCVFLCSGAVLAASAGSCGCLGRFLRLLRLLSFSVWLLLFLFLLVLMLLLLLLLLLSLICW
jgi:hypothetical protein